MSETDELAGVFSVIDAETTAHDPVEQEEVSEEAVAEGAESTPVKETEDSKEQKESEVENQETSTPVEGKQDTETQTETEEHSKTENTEQDFSNWKQTLPPAPQPYAGLEPVFDENGGITNMSPTEYSQYITAKATEAMRNENYSNTVENQALDIAEKILPDIKTNQSIRQLVENARIASVLSGNSVDTVAAAIQVRDALGISPEKLAAAKTEGANNAKASVTIQKNAALETGSSQKKNTNEGEKITGLQQRIQRGDDSAFADLLSIWEEQGVI